MNQSYLIALGSNRRHHRFGSPARVLAAALEVLETHGIEIMRVGPTIASAPIGPSLRRYANAAALITCALDPAQLLGPFKAVERRFGRRPGGQRWASRVLDLDIVLWSGGAWSSAGLIIPHIAFRERRFVLAPSLAVAADWRDPISGLSLRQLHSRLTRPRPAPR